MKTKFVVELDLPPRVGREEMKGLILGSIKSIPGFYETTDPISNLNKNLIRVKYASTKNINAGD